MAITWRRLNFYATKATGLKLWVLVAARLINWFPKPINSSTWTKITLNIFSPPKCHRGQSTVGSCHKAHGFSGSFSHPAFDQRDHLENPFGIFTTVSDVILIWSRRAC